MSNHHRPRVNRENRNCLLAHASRLNGQEVRQVNDALAILSRYLNVLYGEVDHCPNCGTDCIDSRWYGDVSMNQREMSDGQWYCHRCRDAFYRSEYLDPDEPENAEIPTW